MGRGFAGAPTLTALLAVAATLPALAQAATFRGANGQIAFRFSPSPGAGDIAVINPDGQGFAPLTTTPLDESDPSYSGDGERIALQSGPVMGQSDIWVMDADGRNATQITSGPDDDASPSFYLDGAHIAFNRTTGGSSDIWAVSADGTGLTRLTDTPTVNEFGPEVSPDGTRIAFTREFGGSNEIFVMGAEGSDPFPITTTPSDDRWPKWSPDGTQIVYERDGGADSDIMLIGAGGGTPQPLTSGSANDTNPAFSPDGTSIVFSRETNLFLMGADGSNPTPLTLFGTEQAHLPDWQPLNPPSVVVTAGEQKSPKRVTVTVASGSENAAVSLDGTLKAPKPKASASKKKTVELDAVTLQLEPGVSQTVEIPVSGKGGELLKKALRAGKRPKGTVTATASDDFGASSNASADVKYKKRKKK